MSDATNPRPSAPKQKRPAATSPTTQAKPNVRAKRVKQGADDRKASTVIGALDIVSVAPPDVAEALNRKIASMAAEYAVEALTVLRERLHTEEHGVPAARAILSCHVALNKPVAPKAPKSVTTNVSVDQRNQILATGATPGEQAPQALRQPERVSAADEWGFGQHASPAPTPAPRYPVVKPALHSATGAGPGGACAARPLPDLSDVDIGAAAS